MILLMSLMVLLCFIVGGIALKQRMGSVKRGEVRTSYFTTMQGDNIPEQIIKTTRCFNNLFEMPMLFYVVCTLFLILDLSSMFVMVLGGVFVVSRYVHTYIHLTYNNVIHRMLAFWVGCIAIGMMWIALLLLHTFQI